MLVGLSIRSVGIQSLLELQVALIQLAGQQFIPVDESLTELGGRVPHFVPNAGSSSLDRHSSLLSRFQAVQVKYASVLHVLKEGGRKKKTVKSFVLVIESSKALPVENQSQEFHPQGCSGFSATCVFVRVIGALSPPSLCFYMLFFFN